MSNNALSNKQMKILKVLLRKAHSVVRFAARDIDELESMGLIEQFYYQDELVPYEGMAIRLTEKGHKVAEVQP